MLMVIFYIISFVLLCIICYLCKHIVSVNGDEFTFKMWHLLCLTCVFAIPFMNVFLLVAIVFTILLMWYCENIEMDYNITNSKIIKFLNKKL